MSKFVKGQKVHYCARHGDKKENGIVKSVTGNGQGIFVVYHCAEEWDNYENYTAALTPASEVKAGWV